MLAADFPVSNQAIAISCTWVIAFARFTMLRDAFQYLAHSYGFKRLLAAIMSCACLALTARADERVNRLAATGAEKTAVSQPANSAAAEKNTKAHIQQLIRELG